jgi:hypothetical protein
VVVNFAQADTAARSRLGREVLLPPWGFVIDGPRFAAFYAKKWNGRDYAEGALFTLQATAGDNLEGAAEIRIFHGFGTPTVPWRGATYEVRRELIVHPGRSKEAPAADKAPS